MLQDECWVDCRLNEGLKQDSKLQQMQIKVSVAEKDDEMMTKIADIVRK